MTGVQTCALPIFKFAEEIASSKVCMLASATEKQKRVTAKSKLRMQKRRAKTKSVLAKAVPEVMVLDAVLVNHMTTHVGATTEPTATRGVKHKKQNCHERMKKRRAADPSSRNVTRFFFPKRRGHMTSLRNVTRIFFKSTWAFWALE